MIDISLKLINIKHNKMLPLKTEELEVWKSSKVCYKCEEEFNNKHKKFWKTKDHRHFPGKYSGEARCVINLSILYQKK